MFIKHSACCLVHNRIILMPMWCLQTHHFCSVQPWDLGYHFLDLSAVMELFYICAIRYVSIEYLKCPNGIADLTKWLIVFFNPRPRICLLILERKWGEGIERERETSNWNLLVYSTRHQPTEPKLSWYGVCYNHKKWFFCPQQSR